RRPDGDFFESEPFGRRAEDEHADRRADRRAQVILPAMMQQADARGMTPRHFVHGDAFDRRADSGRRRRRTIATDEEIGHPRARDRTVASGIAPQERELLVYG